MRNSGKNTVSRELAEPGTSYMKARLVSHDRAFHSCLVVDLFCFISLCLRVAVFLNATRKNRNLPPFTLKGKNVDQCNTLKRSKEVHNRRGYLSLFATFQDRRSFQKEGNFKITSRIRN